MSTIESRPHATRRLSVSEVDPEAYNGMLAIEKYVHAGDLEPKTLHLLKIRASQINGCAYCLDMHTTESRKDGENQRRLDVLAAWREAPSWFSEAEQAVLELTEEVTLIGNGGVSDEVWTRVKSSFSEDQIIRLLMAISAINTWNRLAISTHQELSPL